MPKSVAVVVLGDIGRSPRMQYHALSLANHQFQVHLIGYGGSERLHEVQSHSNIRVHELVSASSNTQLPEIPGLFLVRAAFKVLLLLGLLFYVLLWKLPQLDFILVQNPPSVPSLCVVWIVSKLRRCKLVVDWHNFGYTIFQMSTTNKLARSLYKWNEFFFGRRADAHLCVTKAMQDNLLHNWGIRAVVLYDRPAPSFHKATREEYHKLFCRLESSQPALSAALARLTGYSSPATNEASDTAFTTVRDNKYYLRKDRPALLVSSTSWTADEDFGMLLQALELYEQRAQQQHTTVSLPKVLLIVTGKGPLKQHFEGLMSVLNQRCHYVQCVTLWLSPADYPLLLGSSDIGISLHYSSSGLDLPMKVVDMFGANLPVLAVNFKCLNELVKDGKNGLLFSDACSLIDNLQALLTGFPDATPVLNQMRAELHTYQQQTNRWDFNWDRNALPLFS